ncbi:MAG: hypothetical protein CFH19_01024 [Alphaproteobacteria bacterium MarineAlpha5_Bin9]|nr:MAG: hypothetical protein CFH19_01024 [Alphaproteobacteria bacterium MarineAlpha5_Bin9]|tara:strand:+ start:7757 stop:8422 length:666 start_codon:yes stop_codon:yes gene_type:complete
MKIKKRIVKNFFIQYFLAFLTFLYILFVRYTSKIIKKNNNVPKEFWINNKPFILAFWHSQLMMISYCWESDKKINIIASNHSDGRFGAIVGKFFNLKNIPSSKDILVARKIYQIIKNNEYIGITPDGPRGPKKKVSNGIIKIAKSLNIPIIPCGFWSSKNKQLNSWDSFLITLPFARCSFVWAKPIYIKKNISDKEILKYQKILENEINNCILKAKENIFV